MANHILFSQGRVIDPANDIDRIMDLEIKEGKVVALSPHLSREGEKRVIDLKGLLVTPGLVDAHVHCYYNSAIPRSWAGDYSIQPDSHNFKSGVTTMVDTGSAGSYNFAHFEASVIQRARTRIYALLNIADYGMSSLEGEQFPEKNNLDSLISCFEKYANTLVGLKVAHYDRPDWGDLEYAKLAQGHVNRPIMVDFGVFRKERPYEELVSQRLDRGDISTHCFRGPVPVLDDQGKVYDYLWKARERGIKFDLGHGAGSFLFRNALPALKQGFYPDSISTDLHYLSINNPVADMATTLSKVKACCDISLFDLFRFATISPAEMYGLTGDGGPGTLSVGAPADLAVWSLREGDFGFIDSGGGVLRGQERLECEMTCLGGDIVWDKNGRMGVLYTELPPLYGFDQGVEELVKPGNVKKSS
jgi:dihydroorotase